ncbi:MAG: hypothetical protein EZS28_046354, partial [Streblomastix strix]
AQGSGRTSEIPFDSTPEGILQQQAILNSLQHGYIPPSQSSSFSQSSQQFPPSLAVQSALHSFEMKNQLDKQFEQGSIQQVQDQKKIEREQSLNLLKRQMYYRQIQTLEPLVEKMRAEPWYNTPVKACTLGQKAESMVYANLKTREIQQQTDLVMLRNGIFVDRTKYMTESCIAVGNLQASDILHSAMDGEDMDYLQVDMILDVNSFYGVARKANINQGIMFADQNQAPKKDDDQNKQMDKIN